jgi:hypothetical protein
VSLKKLVEASLQSITQIMGPQFRLLALSLLASIFFGTWLAIALGRNQSSPELVGACWMSGLFVVVNLRLLDYS